MPLVCRGGGGGGGVEEGGRERGSNGGQGVSCISRLNLLFFNLRSHSLMKVSSVLVCKWYTGMHWGGGMKKKSKGVYHVISCISLQLLRYYPFKTRVIRLWNAIVLICHWYAKVDRGLRKRWVIKQEGIVYLSITTILSLIRGWMFQIDCWVSVLSKQTTQSMKLIP